MKNSFMTLALSILAASLYHIAASGEIVTFNFIGNVSSVYNPFGVVSSSLVQVGDPIQVSLRYDTATPDGNSETNRGTYLTPGWLKVSVNDLSFEQTTTIQIDILHGANGGQELFQVLALNPTAWPQAVPAYPFQRLLLGFWETGPPYDFLSSADLPTTLDWSRADVRNGSIATGTSSLNMYEFQFQLAQVPEPATATLMVWAGLCWLLRKSSRIIVQRSNNLIFQLPLPLSTSPEAR